MSAHVIRADTEKKGGTYAMGRQNLLQSRDTYFGSPEGVHINSEPQQSLRQSIRLPLPGEGKNPGFLLWIVPFECRVPSPEDAWHCQF